MAKIEIFSSPDCGYCNRAKELLRARGLAFDDLDVATDAGHREDFVSRLPRVRSIPQIFIAGQHIGGYEDLCILAESGRLDEMTG